MDNIRSENSPKRLFKIKSLYQIIYKEIMSLGQKLKKVRVEKHITQKFLADQLHISYQTISKWENDINEPNLESIRQLSKLLDCSIEYLVSD